MITKKDISKLKKVFVTKRELRELKNTISTKLATKEDIKILSKDIHIVINMIGDSLSQSKEQDDILDNHERRLDKIEDKVFSTN